MVGLALDDTLGAAFLGATTPHNNCSLYGITIVQTYIYYKRNRSDPTYLKLLVTSTVHRMLDSLHLALITHAVYFYAVTNFTNLLELMIPTWCVFLPTASGVSDGTVRGIFCQRVWKLSNRNWLLCLAIVVSSLVVFSGSIAFAVKGFSIASFADLPQISDILYVSLGAGVVADVLIAASMCVLLAKRRTGFARTDSMVRVLMMYSINTGALTSLCAMLCLITYANMPNNFVFIAFYFVLPKLFLNSLLATLNARRRLRESSSAAMVSIPLSTTSNSRMSFSSRPQYSHNRGGQSDQLNLEIQVQTVTDSKTDPDPHGECKEESESKSWHPVYSTAEEPIAIAV
ncbi:hypothetical protein K466DRAFT_511700 [Polyporus arcularius HHB13444]|uniref:DUF6534 domain-containing protein n=1 Tax=Polyporus arcularius HHB13444 TaxID=1314778 RepID=A0A5C3PV07_9APHY|nr:hypothetical protein K466DRAFT_511700 [Polyporus arcularius HHB13444]